MNLSAERLRRILNEGPVPFRFGDYINQGFQFMNKNLGLLIAFMLVSSVISFICQSIPYLGFVLSLIVSPVLSVGYSQFTYMVSRGRQPDFGEFFKGFSKIGPLILTYLLMTVISVLALLPGLFFWYQAGMFEWFQEIMAQYPLLQDIPDLREMVDMSKFWTGLLLMVVGGMTVSILFIWALQITWFFDAGPLESLDASRRLISRNWGSMLGFLIVTGLITVSGVLLCGFGLLYTVPAMVCAQFFAFADAVHLLDDPEADQPDLIDHFIA